MCLTVPAQIKQVFFGQAELADGRLVKIDLISDLQIGDWVLLQDNFVINKISGQESGELLSYFSSLDNNSQPGAGPVQLQEGSRL
jgi:hydrogenase maturation factor